MSSNHRRSSNSIEKEVSSRTSIILFSEGQELRFRVMACALYTPQLNQITFGGLPSTHLHWIQLPSVVCPLHIKTESNYLRWFALNTPKLNQMKRRVHVLPTPKMSQIALNLPRLNETRPDTRQDSRGQLGRSRNAKINRNSEMLRTDGRTHRGPNPPSMQTRDQPTTP